jgi:hypothetical protein
MATEQLVLPQVPPIPADAVNWRDIRSHVWESGNMRWRTANGSRDSTLHVFIEYGAKESGRAPTQLRRYSDGRF